MDKYANLKYEKFFQKELKIIFHIDIDSFFVSCERILKPWLSYKPVVISRHSSKAIITSVSYEVRKIIGVSNGVSLREIRKQVKGLYVIRPNYDFYEKKSQQFYSFLNRNYSCFIEKFSIDEVFMDVTNLWQEWGDPTLMALHIQRQIKEELNLPSTIGISYTKFGAKMATNLAKPRGILKVMPKDFAKTFYPLPIISFWGIGPKSVEKLEEIGIKTIGDLAKKPYDDKILKKILGKRVTQTLENAKGIGEDEIDPLGSNPQEMGQSFTFLKGVSSSRKYVLGKLKNIVYNIVTKAQKDQNVGNVIVVLIRLPNQGNWFSKQQRLKGYTNKFEILFSLALTLFNRLWVEEGVYGVGFKLKNLKTQDQIDPSQEHLWDTLDQE